MDQNNKKVSIIIVNWNNAEDLKRCIESLIKISYKKIEIVIVDNGSTDDSIDEIKKIQKRKKHFFLIQNKKNLGFAQGNNIGYAKTTGEFVLFLNNDTVVTKNFLEPLVAKIKESPNIAGVQPKILQYPKKNIIDSVGSYFITSGFLYHYGHNKKDKKEYNKESEIYSMKGACMLFKKEVLEKIGVFDSDYFAYFEETDICHRAWVAGYKILFTSKSFIYHRGGQTAKRLPSSFILYHSYKNRIYTYLKNFQLTTILKIIPLHILFCQIVSLVYCFTLQFPLAFAVQKAILWNILHAHITVKKRSKVQELRKVSDDLYIWNISRHVRVSYYYHLFTTSLRGYKD